MFEKNTARTTGIHAILSDPRVLWTERDDEHWYSAAGVVQVLTESDHPEEIWNDLKSREPVLDRLSDSMEFISDDDGNRITLDALNLAGVLRLVQSVPSDRAERLRGWLVESAMQWLEESADPELAMVRARRLYEQRGFSRRWIDKRLHRDRNSQEVETLLDDSEIERRSEIQVAQSPMTVHSTHRKGQITQNLASSKVA